MEKPDTLALPSEAYIEIQNRRIESTATTVLKYVQDNIKDIARIVSCPELDPDSVDTNPYAAESDGKGVALLFKNDPRKFTIENPLSFMQYPVQPEGLEMVVPLRGSYRRRYHLLPHVHADCYWHLLIHPWSCRTFVRRLLSFCKGAMI